MPPRSTFGAAAGKHPLFRGIRTRSGKWVSEIREPGKTTRIWLGTYPTPEMAAAAYDVAVHALRGNDTALNFPSLVDRYPVPASHSPADIRSAAAAGATIVQRIQSSGDWEAGGVNDGARPAADVDEMHGNGEYIDEEALFDMPNLLVDMAGGMMVSPPRMSTPAADDPPSNSDIESLWSY
ncbi:unnamed protein product [Cuscuta campestris]|uniref:AP2/ERF domain-containing protein n=1 Tax=Cuscuta campestris TaxID=132261 RepID=A0A484KJB0_9ASTE|nr:unnamed protein product [Cuscuta campestris]